MDAEKAEKMLEAIEKKHETGNMDDGAYQILRKRYEDMLEDLGAEREKKGETPKTEGEEKEKAPESLPSLASNLMSDIGEFKEEIAILQSEKKSTKNLLNDLKKKFEKGSISEERFEKMSERHKSRMMDLKSQITDKQEEIKQSKNQLNDLSEDIQNRVKDYKQVLRKIKNFKS